MNKFRAPELLMDYEWVDSLFVVKDLTVTINQY